MSLSGTSLSRSGWALTCLAGVSVWLTAPQTPAEFAAVTGPDFPAALLGLVVLTQLLIAGWVVLVISLAQVAGAGGIVRTLTPRAFRATLFAGTAGVLAVAPAHADPGAATSPGQVAVHVASHDLDGLPLPDRPRTGRAHPTADRVVIVRPGDTLWAIARRSLPGGASDVATAHSCAEWFAANRDVIGTDPDLILPNQRLHAPIKEHS